MDKAIHVWDGLSARVLGFRAWGARVDAQVQRIGALLLNIHL